jgi:hypothetical protein
MRFLTHKKTVIEPPLFNLLLGIIGLTIVWAATHNWVAILGSFIAAIHIQITVTPKENN